jgi:hypothetical protein
MIGARKLNQKLASIISTPWQTAGVHINILFAGEI